MKIKTPPYASGTISYTWNKAPSIPVSEISRLLINLRKAINKEQKSYPKHFLQNDYWMASIKTIENVRKILQLRKRSREGVKHGKGKR